MPIGGSTVFDCVNVPHFNQYQMVRHEREEILFAHFMNGKGCSSKSSKKETKQKSLSKLSLTNFACEGAGNQYFSFVGHMVLSELVSSAATAQEQP